MSEPAYSVVKTKIGEQTFRFDTFQVPDTVTFFLASAPWGTQERAINGLKAVQNFTLHNMPAELNMRVFITGRFVNLEGLYYGDKAGLKAALQPLLNKTSATLQLSQEGTWLDQVKHFGSGMALDQGHPYNYVSACLPSARLRGCKTDMFAARDVLLNQPVHPSSERRADHGVGVILVQDSQG
jgi:hypothetical protein